MDSGVKRPGNEAHHSLPTSVVVKNTWIYTYTPPNPSSRIMALGSTQPPTEMSARNLPEGNVRPVFEADNLTGIFETIF
jgi:hypothetical protein